MEKIIVPFQIETKNFVEEKDFFTFKGHGAVFGNIDFGNDRIHPGAFIETISELKVKNKNIPVLWQHDRDVPLGVFISLAEDEKGLFVEGKLPKEDTFVHGRVMPQMKIGSVRELSIGFIPIEWHHDENGTRNLTQIKLIEISLVTMAMNELATVTDMKSVVSFEDLPLADRDRHWDEKEAKQRVTELSGEEENKCFIWHDKKSESYKLQISDIVDGRLTAVPKAIFEAAAAVQGIKGKVDIPESDIPGVKRHLEQYYKKMGLESPFKSNNSFRVDEISVFNNREMERCLKTGISFSGEGAKKIISVFKKFGLLRDEGSEGHRDGKDWKQVINEINNVNKMLKGKIDA
jgi:HK97 family phage prohead protease